MGRGSGRGWHVQRPGGVLRIPSLLVEAQTPRPCPDLLNQHLWGRCPGAPGSFDGLPKDPEIKPGLDLGWIVHVGGWPYSGSKGSEVAEGLEPPGWTVT